MDEINGVDGEEDARGIEIQPKMGRPWLLSWTAILWRVLEAPDVGEAVRAEPSAPPPMPAPVVLQPPPPPKIKRR